MSKRKTLESARKESVEVVYMTTEEVVEVLFWSYYFSQGNPGLQGELFVYAKQSYPNHLIHLTHVQAQEVQNEVKRRLKKMVEQGRHADVESDKVEDSVSWEYMNMVNVFNATYKQTPDWDRSKDSRLRGIIKTMSIRDSTYITGKGMFGGSIPWREGEAIMLKSFLSSKYCAPWPFDILMKDLSEYLKICLEEGRGLSEEDLSRVMLLISAHNHLNPKRQIGKF